MTRKNLIIGILCALGCEVLYGLSYVFTKQATDQASALSLLGWRFIIAFVVMSGLAVTGLLPIHLRGKKLLPVLRVAVFCPVIYFIGETFGVSLTTASESGVIIAGIPIASLIASTLILHKKPTKRQVVGITVTLIGVCVTVLAVGMSSSLSVAGYAFLILAVVSYSLSAVYIDYVEDCNGAEITFAQIIAGAAAFCCMALIESVLQGNTAELLTLPMEDTGFLIAVLYQGIGCSIMGFLLANIAILKIGVNRVSTFVGVSTVVSILAGAFLLGEAFTIGQVIGTIVIIAGVYIANANAKADADAQ